jgi:hypothetical protein
VARRARVDLRVIAAAAVFSTAALIGAACTFPSASFVADGSEGGSSGSSGSSGSGGEAGEAGPDGGGRDADLGGDVEEHPDGSTHVDEGGCKSACDCDGDGFVHASCDGGPDASLDCDDFDSFIHPGPRGWIQDPWPSTSTWKPEGDWNCDSNPEKHFPTGLQCGATSCGAQGFEDDPPCGTESVYYSCSGFLCPANPIDNGKIQECR